MQNELTLNFVITPQAFSSCDITCFKTSSKYGLRGAFSQRYQRISSRFTRVLRKNYSIAIAITMYLDGAFDRYWRLDERHQSSVSLRDELSAFGFTSTELRIPNYRLQDLLRRVHQGLLCYQRCTEQELLKFARDRNIPQRMSKTWRSDTPKDILVKLLEHADEQLSFTKFLDLPPEVRVRIYELHDEDFDAVLSTPTLPPLARTCKLLQREVSPIFYKRHTFWICYVLRNQHDSGRHVRQDVDTALWLFTVSPEYVQNIRSLNVTVRLPWYPLDGDRFYTFHIELSRSSKGYSVKMVEREGLEEPRDDIIEAEISKLLDLLPSQDGTKTLRLEDIHALRGAIEASYESFLKSLRDNRR